MHRLMYLATVGALATTPQSSAQENTPAQQLPTTAAPSMMVELDASGFANEAAASNQFEILSAEVALKRSQSPEVKDFAASIIKDHRRAQDELQAAAKADSINLTVNLTAEQVQSLKALEQAEDSQFDSAFLSAQMKAHDRAISILGSYADAGEAGSLKTWATAYYPTVRMHKVRSQSLSNP
jgi:putative membrane protein